MTDNEKDIIIKEFRDSISENDTFEDLVESIKNISDKEKKSIISMSYCDDIIDDFYFYYGWSYPTNIKLANQYLVEAIFKPLYSLTPEEHRPYYSAIMSFYNGNLSECFELLKDGIDSYIKNDGILDEFWFGYNYLIFKGAIPKLYDYILERISSEHFEKGLPELIKASKVYFCSTDILQLEQAASEALLIIPDSILAKELIAEAWFGEKRWNNAIASLESTENGYIFSEHERLFMLAWCKSKTRDKKGAIECYQKCLDIAPQKQWARNNLAYEYYITKQYNLAEKEYLKCIDEKMDLKLACTGYVRTLTAMGKYSAAEEFIKHSPEKIYKNALEYLKKAKSGKKSFKSEVLYESAFEELDEISSNDRKPIFQFSKERILEDELEERLLVGTTVFGIPLKIFKRTGEYGRQWPIAGLGRIDLLAEDNSGNLYVIELKKDSGYDDAYAQTVKYIEWFEKSKYAKGKKVYGIICVNEPPKELIKAVHDDNRIRLFEYKISYNEIKY